jgi:hypothetical protein
MTTLDQLKKELHQCSSLKEMFDKINMKFETDKKLSDLQVSVITAGLLKSVKSIQTITGIKER